MEQPEILHTDNDTRGVFFIKENDKTIASLTYSFDDRVMTVDHTEVNPAHEGKGLGSSLVAASYEYARDKSYKINPLCPFTEVVFDNHPEWSNVRV